MNILEWIIMFLIGMIAGTFGSIVGLGGGIIVVPALLFINSVGVLSVPILPQNAVGISLMVIIFTAIASTVYNYKQNKVDIKSGLFFFLASGSFALVGSYINQYIELKQFYIIFGLVMIFITYLLSKKKNKKAVNVSWHVIKHHIDESGEEWEYGYNKVIAFAVSGFAGLLAGLFGIGGGAILVPMMVILFHFPPHIATATSMFIILLSATVGSISHLVLGNIIFIYVLMIAPGAYLGGKLGSFLATKLSSQGLIKLLRIVIILVAIQMIYKGL